MTDIELIEAENPADYEQAAEFCRAFQRWLYVRYPDDHALIDAYYPPDKFEALMARLPEIHARPQGTILIARLGGVPVGCCMVHELAEPGVCEMKRMFVDEAARGKGVARALCEGLFAWSRAAGYRTMRLDTGPLHHEALALYRAVGFTERGPYYDPGPEWIDRLIYFERPL